MTELERYQDALTIQRVLHTARTIAVVGLSGNQLRAVPPNTQTCHCPMAKLCGSRWLKWSRRRAGHYFPKA